MIKLINDDCMNVIKNYQDLHFDLAIVDPPYGIELDYFNRPKSKYKNSLAHNKKYHLANTLNNMKPNKEYFKELKRVSKNQIIWGGNYYIEYLSNTPCYIIWDKQNTGNWADCEMAWTSFKSPAKIFQFMWNGMLQKDMRNKEERIHPTQKPVALYKWLLHNYSKKGQKILDTHLGSGSIGIACHYFGVDLTGVEIDKKYFQEAKKRIDLFTRQTTIF
jgi:site-specific DNA-methyltransferase (adenine-specific)